MADVAPSYQERQEFWKPVVATRPESEQVAEAGAHACRHCGADLVFGAQFCHICGTDRRVDSARSVRRRLPAWLDFAALCDALGQCTASLVALILGCVCIVAAGVTSFAFTASTLLDWQAIQLWRIEWLLGAIALFGAGFLLKK